MLRHAPYLPPRPRRFHTIVMPDTARRHTVDEVLAFPSDGNRYELVDGELLVTPAPGPVHQHVVSRLQTYVSAYLDKHAAELEAIVSPADITWGQDRLVQPDLFVIPTTEISRDWGTYVTLVLAVEVLSPSSGHADRVVKRRLYQERNVRTYWVVDPDARLVEVWRPDEERPEIVTEVLTWRAAPEAPDLTIRLEQLFANLAG